MRIRERIPRFDTYVSIIRQSVIAPLDDGNIIIWSIALVKVSFILSFVIDFYSVGEFFFRQVIGTIYVLFAPGVLLLGILNVNLNRWRSFVYIIATSAGLLTIFGLAINTVGLLPIPSLVGNVFTEPSIVISLVFFVSSLMVIFHYSGNSPDLPSKFSNNSNLWIFVLWLLGLPMLAAMGAILIQRYDQNMVLLLTFLLLAFTPFIALNRDIDSRYYPAILGAVALALAIQAPLLTQHLSYGDGAVEYAAAISTIQNGVWFPTYLRPKSPLPRLTILYPIYAQFVGIDLKWVMKVLHPMTMPIIAIGVFEITRTQFSEKISFLTTFIYISLHPFFVLLSQNTRTGGAVIFMVSVMVLLLDKKIKRTSRTIIFIVLILSVVTAHDGTTYLFLGMLIFAYVLTKLDSVIDWSGKYPLSQIRSTHIGIFGSLIFLWYAFTTESVYFDRLVTKLYSDVLIALTATQPESKTLRGVTTEFESITYQFIQIEFIIISLLSGLGILLGASKTRIARRIFPEPFVSRLDTNSFHIQPVLYSLSLAAIALLLISLLPIQIMGVGRMYMIAGILTIPYGVYFVTTVFDSNLLKISSIRKLPLSFNAISTIVIAVVLLFNSGFLATTVFLESSPQPVVDKERILNSGTDREVYELYLAYNPHTDYLASKWVGQNIRTVENIYAPASLSGIMTREAGFIGMSPRATNDIPLDGKIEHGYIFIPEYSTRSDQIILTQSGARVYPLIMFNETSEIQTDQINKIYSNRGADIYIK